MDGFEDNARKLPSGVVPLLDLYEHVKGDKAGEGLRGASKAGRAYNVVAQRLAQDIATWQGFYLWGAYDDKCRWVNIYLGKAGYGKIANLRARVLEELKDERSFAWRTVLTEDELLKIGEQYYPAMWEKQYRTDRFRHFRKAGTTHIVWVATPDLDNQNVGGVESDLIETLNPAANISRPTPQAQIKESTWVVLGALRHQIHVSRPSSDWRPLRLKK
jgi:hypothetical protein